MTQKEAETRATRLSERLESLKNVHLRDLSPAQFISRHV